MDVHGVSMGDQCKLFVRFQFCLRRFTDLKEKHLFEKMSRVDYYILWEIVFKYYFLMEYPWIIHKSFL